MPLELTAFDEVYGRIAGTAANARTPPQRPLAADRRVPNGQRAELGVEYEAHGEQVTVEHHPVEHVGRQHDHFDGIDRGPDGRPVVHCLRHAGQPRVVDGRPVSGRRAVPVDDLHVRDVGQQRRDDPHGQRTVADGGERPEQRGHRGAGPLHVGRPTVAARRVPVTGHVQHFPQPVGVVGQHEPLERAHQPVERQHGHGREPPQVVGRRVQPGHLQQLHGHDEAREPHVRGPKPAARRPALQHVVQADGLEQRQISGRLVVVVAAAAAPVRDSRGPAIGRGHGDGDLVDESDVVRFENVFEIVTSFRSANCNAVRNKRFKISNR